MALVTRRRFISTSVALGCTSVLSRFATGQGKNASSVGTRLYVVDSRGDSPYSQVHILDGGTGELIQSLPARYHPDINVSLDGRLLYVCDSAVLHPDGVPPTAKIRVYDAMTFELLQKTRVPQRPIYPVMATGAVVLSRDGRFVHLPKRKLSPMGKPRNYLISYDLFTQKVVPHRLKLPSTPAFIQCIPGRPELLVGIQGKRLEGMGWADPIAHKQLATLHKFKKPSRRGPGFLTAGVGVDSAGNLAYSVTRNGHLHIVNIANDRIANDGVPLALPSGCGIPMRQFLVAGDQLIAGVSSLDKAAQGISDSLLVFDRISFRLLGSYPLGAAVHQISLAPDGSTVYAASFRPSPSIMAFSNGRQIAQLPQPGETMTRFLVAPAA